MALVFILFFHNDVYEHKSSGLRANVTGLVRLFPNYTSLLLEPQENTIVSLLFLSVYPTETHVTAFACSTSNFVMKFLGQ